MNDLPVLYRPKTGLLCVDKPNNVTSFMTNMYKNFTFLFIKLL